MPYPLWSESYATWAQHTDEASRPQNLKATAAAADPLLRIKFPKSTPNRPQMGSKFVQNRPQVGFRRGFEQRSGEERKKKGRRKAFQ